MVIRSLQINRLEESAAVTLAANIASRLRQDFPAHVAKTNEAELLRRVNAGIKMAESYGLTKGPAIYSFVALMTTIGPDFDSYPLVRHCFAQPGSGEERMQQVFATMTSERWKSAASRSDPNVWQIVLATYAL